MLVSEERGNQSTPRKTYWSKEENQQTQPTYDAGSGNQIQDTLAGGECSHHCAIPAPQKTLLAKNYICQYLEVKFRQIQQITSSALPKAYMEMYNW